MGPWTAFSRRSGRSRDEVMRGQQQVAERLILDRSQSYEHARMRNVVRLEVINVGLFLDQRIALIERHHDDERIRLGVTMRRRAADHLSVRAERWHTPRGPFLGARQRAAEPANTAEPNE